MADGTENNIENIKAGDKIKSVDMSTMTIEEVYEIRYIPKDYQIIVAEYSNGIINEFSPSHYWFFRIVDTLFKSIFS